MLFHPAAMKISIFVRLQFDLRINFVSRIVGYSVVISEASCLGNKSSVLLSSVFRTSQTTIQISR